jgi:hypothetical protein
MRYFYDCEFIDDGKTIDLISIGIVCEDGRELYMQSSEFEIGKANGWVVENVLPHLWKAYHSRAAIRDAILAFMAPDIYGKPELWGYYSAYDHVAFCHLFGAMMQLPKGFPMYTRDIKQWCDCIGNPPLPEQGKGEHHALADARWNRCAWEFLREYEHQQKSKPVQITSASQLLETLDTIGK